MNCPKHDSKAQKTLLYLDDNDLDIGCLDEHILCMITDCYRTKGLFIKMIKLYKKLGLFLGILFHFCVAQAAIQADKLIVYPESESGNARAAIIQEINQAHETIYVSAYQLKDPDLAQALIDSTKRKVRVALIVEKNPYKHAFNVDDKQDVILQQLLAAGVVIYERPEYLKVSHPTGHHHARYLLIDSNRFLLTTGNFDETTFDHCRDFAVTFNRAAHPEEFAALQQLFESDIHNLPLPSAFPASVIIGPDQQREKIVSFLRTAKKSIKLYQQYFNDPAILDEISHLIAEKQIKVELLMMAYPTGYDREDPSASAQDQLKSQGGDVRLIPDFYGHARAIIIDDQYALIGTAQLSPASLDQNREVSLIIQGSIVAQLIAQFQADQSRALSLEEGRGKALREKRDWNLITNKH